MVQSQPTRTAKDKAPLGRGTPKNQVLLWQYSETTIPRVWKAGEVRQQKKEERQKKQKKDRADPSSCPISRGRHGCFFFVSSDAGQE